MNLQVSVRDSEQSYGKIGPYPTHTVWLRYPMRFQFLIGVSLTRMIQRGIYPLQVNHRYVRSKRLIDVEPNVLEPL